ncbi:MAG TPA: response regulator transcription factor, partial [Rhodospirillales bacterium]|nr:response regulator transcription factor [Rhodospirillales bacterium]
MLEACPPRPKVLVVDDEFDISSFVCEAAERQGYDAVALNDPEKFTRESLADVNLIFL